MQIMNKIIGGKEVSESPQKMFFYRISIIFEGLSSKDEGVLGKSPANKIAILEAMF